MAGVINNLRVNEVVPKNVLFNGIQIKELWFNGELIWKNSNPFKFVKATGEELPQMAEETLLFVGFSDEEFNGSYNVVEKLEPETAKEGQMVVVNTTDGEKE